jgi:hypothetical protein
MSDTDDDYSENEFTPEERKAIETHKYYLSKEAGLNVGMAYAIAHWLVYYAPAWRHERLRRDLEDQWMEIEKHKWIESERAGTDLGYHAAMDWIKKHAANWLRRRQENLEQ